MHNTSSQLAAKQGLAELYALGHADSVAYPEEDAGGMFGNGQEECRTFVFARASNAPIEAYLFVKTLGGNTDNEPDGPGRKWVPYQAWVKNGVNYWIYERVDPGGGRPALWHICHQAFTPPKTEGIPTPPLTKKLLKRAF